jgi:pimeloyl-ACP methyl ester carboxylesterase
MGTNTAHRETNHAAQAVQARPVVPPGLVRRRGSRIFLVVVAVSSWGLLAGWWTPRGPVTTGQALTAMAAGLFLGVASGLVLGSRWAMLLSPAVFVVVFEFARIGTDGPTVDGPRASTYGLLALIVGRGIHGLLALVPMLLGASLGAAAARRRRGISARQHGWSRVGRQLRTGAAALTTIGIVLLTVGLVRPASTAPILDTEGQSLPGSVAELTRVDINGHKLAMMIRGSSTHNPVLLFLAGGPGGTELGAMRHHGQALEREFVVVTLDQRGTGRSYDQLDPTSTLTLEGAVNDTVAVTNYLRERFGQDKIYLLGQSWGTILGVLAAQQRPELFRAFIGSGQMVDPRETDLITYQDTLAWAKRNGDTGLVSTLTRIGAPPYASILDYEPALSFEQEVYPYDHSGNAEGEGQMGEGILVGEYSLLDQLHAFAGFLDTFPVLYPQLQHIDLRTDAPQLEIPVYLFQGAHEASSRALLADQWFNILHAPHKQVTIAETSGHRSLWEQPAEFHNFMTQTVLAQTRTED